MVVMIIMVKDELCVEFFGFFIGFFDGKLYSIISCGCGCFKKIQIVEIEEVDLNEQLFDEVEYMFIKCG